MKVTGFLAGLAFFCAVLTFDSADGAAQSSLSPGYAAADSRYTPSERAGREIWFFATAFNSRFFTYTYPQRLGAVVDWFRVLGAERRDQRFEVWGIINNPDCCVPGSNNCPAKSLDETYGFEWCPGDEELLKFVGKQGYRDPACDFDDAPFDQSTPHGKTDQRQDACDLRFGTSTGALGLRKFPNPRFDADKWKALNGSLASWDNYRKWLSDKPYEPDARANRLFDGAVEPPFLIGMACGACHIAFDPLKPPADPANPKWENIDGTVGNQYSRISELLASGMSPHSLEFQLFGRARPGTVDTSALPMDQVNNPGTMNAIINFGRRPQHRHTLTKWYKAASCPTGADPRACWCEPGKPGKCWERLQRSAMVPNVLKGGEDSIGLPEAIQRVYFNIGSCAEQCWVNHVPDLRATDPTQRNYGQTPFDIGQCRRDCASFRAIEDRLADLQNFLLTGRPTDLATARGHKDRRDLVVELEREFGAGAVDRGRTVFAKQCARCHSSQPGPYENADFYATDPDDPTLRIDWLGNDKPELASAIGTHHSRSLHSNHMASRVWAEYASDTLRARAVDTNRQELKRGGGRGYYRNISLLSVWAHAPFMQNNAIGPELCGKTTDPADQYYRSPYVDKQGKPLSDAEAPPCWPYDPSVEGRFALYKASMDALLNPNKRIDKVLTLSTDIVFDIAPKLQLGDIETGLSLKVPKGVPAALLNNLRFKDIIQDLALLKTDRAALDAKYADELSAAEMAELVSGLEDLIAKIIKAPGHYTANLHETAGELIQKYYSNSFARVENAGHPFGQDLTDRQKADLTAFLATL